MKILQEENFVRCVWPDVALPLGKNGDDLVDYFQNRYGVHIEHLEQTKTLPDKTTKKVRADQLFNVQADSTEQFAAIKDKIGARYAKDIVRNKEHHIYTERVYYRYFKRFEDELLRTGELAKEDAYPVNQN